MNAVLNAPKTPIGLCYDEPDAVHNVNRVCEV